MRPGTQTRALSFKVQRQEKSEWCWAAVSASISLFFRPRSAHTQCDVAGSTLELKCCKGTEPAHTEACNLPHPIHPVLGRFHLLAADPILKPLTFHRVCAEIDAGRPLCVLIKWLDHKGQRTNRGHFIAINGYRVTAGQKQFLAVTDPLYGASEIAYDHFIREQGGYRDGHGVWFASFLVANKAID